MKYSRFGTIVLIVCFLAVVGSLCTGTVAAATWYQQSVNVESKIGTDRSIQSLDVMYPISHTDDSLTFTDLRGRIDDDQSVELNLGLAHRAVMTDPLGLSDDAVIGYYGFADRLDSQYNNTFYQATAGAEYFTEKYSFRLNGYLPEDDREPSDITLGVQTSGTQIYIEEFQNYERPLPGYDVELGRTLRFDWGQIYGRGSYFRFHHSDVAEVEGSRFRAGVQLDGSHPDVHLPEESQLTLGMEWQNDQIRDEQTFGVVRFRMPFGTGIKNQKSNIENENTAQPQNRPTAETAGKQSWVYDRLTERIERDVDVVTGRTNQSTFKDTEPAVLAASGRTLDRLIVAEPGAGSGGAATLADPVGLSTALNTAGVGGAVFVRSGSYSTVGETLADGQALIGAGSPIALRRPEGGQRVTYRLTNDDRPTINGTTQKPTIQLDTGTADQVLRGLKLTGDGHVVKSNRNTDVTLRNLVIDATGNENNDGVRLDKPGGDWLMSNLTLTSVHSSPDETNNAIYLEGGSADVTIRETDITFSDTLERGIYVNDLNGDLTIRNTDLTASETGLSIKKVTNVTLENLRATSHERLAVNLTNTASVRADSLTVRGKSGLQIFESEGVTLDGYRALDVANRGLVVSVSEDVSVTNFEILNPGDEAIKVTPISGTLNENLTFEGAVTDAGDTVFVLDQVSGVTYSSLTGTISHDGSSGSVCEVGDQRLKNVSLTLRNIGTGLVTQLDGRYCD